MAPTDSAPPIKPLLAAEEAPAARRFNVQGASDLVIVCDHATNRIPKSLGSLGLEDPSHLERHIGYDIGAEAVTEILARELDCVAVLSDFSRLVVDPNRPPAHPECIPEISDGVTIPANAGLPWQAKEQRLAELFDVYHEMIRKTIIERAHKGGRSPALFSIHSFSPGFGGTPRPWDLGILWDRDPRMAKPLMNLLDAGDWHVGDNEPYSGREIAYTVDVHGSACGIAHAAVELNQEQIGDRAGVEAWAERLLGPLKKVLADPELYKIAFY